MLLLSWLQVTCADILSNLMKVKPDEHSCSGSEELGQSVGFRPVCDFPLDTQDRLDILKDLLNSALLTLWMMWNSSGMQQS